MNIRIFLAALFLFVLAAAPIGNNQAGFTYTMAQAGEGGMAKVSLLLKKLSSSMASIKDFDELEQAGMPKADVDRMRREMNEKINQMTEEAITLIQSL